ncbi:hypothetical protein RND81_13G049600 [Saponaria officinalis]|uniref:Uncharacterized protein n=1 Tax=Saponaria officinalis TaxID=3572 RepID=A0AAW1GW70_SAPOF
MSIMSTGITEKRTTSIKLPILAMNSSRFSGVIQHLLQIHTLYLTKNKEPLSLQIIQITFYKFIHKKPEITLKQDNSITSTNEHASRKTDDGKFLVKWSVTGNKMSAHLHNYSLIAKIKQIYSRN